jgi:hypothetical protein
VPIEVHEFGAAELGIGNGGMAACSRRFGSEKQKVGACNGHLPSTGRTSRILTVCCACLNPTAILI